MGEAERTRAPFGLAFYQALIGVIFMEELQPPKHVLYFWLGLKTGVI